MKRSIFTLLVVALGMTMTGTASASGWTGALTITSITEADYAGEVVQLAISQAVDNSAGCTYHDVYMIRDPNILKGALALLTSALLAGRTVGVLVSTTCDTTGRPTLTAVQIQ